MLSYARQRLTAERRIYMFERAASFIALALMAIPVHSTEMPTVGPDEGEVVATSPTKVDTGLDFTAKFEAETATEFEILGEAVAPGERREMRWRSPQSYGGFAVPTPLIVLNGERPGPVMCFTAAIHGDELNGIEITRRTLQKLTAKELRGTVVSVPIVNFEGFHRRDRYIGDRRDLNRFFPGNAKGSYPSRVAHALFNDVIMKCDALVDLHTGSFYRENLPQVRGDLTHSGVAKLANGFGGLSVLHNEGPPGTLRGAATRAGVPAVVLEIGEALTLDMEQVETAVDGIFTMLRRLKMLDGGFRLLDPDPTFFHSEWHRSETGGIFINEVKLGDRVSKGQKIAEIVDPITSKTEDVRAPFDGTILGRAQNQFVSPGFMLFRIGVEKTLDEMEAGAKAAQRESGEQQKVDTEVDEEESEAMPR
jgi:predicted deacylase